ncbi:hypothetical protein P7K49_024401 [Saguinus oedipus]|uniref:Uncharacterized protein n=1 Tax=Saguinus oedipus TaxID=9490 RepID=A0ABQ9UQ66_SAGOE|nr:hypothetical protein P7K49_024401 [Saguinus oedipus]
MSGYQRLSLEEPLKRGLQEEQPPNLISTDGNCPEPDKERSHGSTKQTAISLTGRINGFLRRREEGLGAVRLRRRKSEPNKSWALCGLVPSAAGASAPTSLFHILQFRSADRRPSPTSQSSTPEPILVPRLGAHSASTLDLEEISECLKPRFVSAVFHGLSRGVVRKISTTVQHLMTGLGGSLALAIITSPSCGESLLSTVSCQMILARAELWQQL